MKIGTKFSDFQNFIRLKLSARIELFIILQLIKSKKNEISKDQITAILRIAVQSYLISFDESSVARLWRVPEHFQGPWVSKTGFERRDTAPPVPSLSLWKEKMLLGML